MNVLLSRVVACCACLLSMWVDAGINNGDFIKAERDGAQICVVLQILDGDEPIPSAKISALMGMNFREKSYYVNGETGDNGQFLLEGKTTGDEIVIKVEKPGFYPTTKKMCYVRTGEEHEVRNGKWQPWGEVLRLQLRKIQSPVQLVTKKAHYTIPSTNQWYGFDMLLSDWVAPLGKGENADFSVRLIWDGKPLYYTKKSELHIRFESEMAGYYVSTNILGSVFGGVYHAATNMMYTSSATIRSSLRNDKVVDEGFPTHGAFVVRSRCVLDGERNIKSANYSTIKHLSVEGGWKGDAVMWIRYYYNPVPNDTNLEPKW